MVQYEYESPLGRILLTADGEGLTGLRFEEEEKTVGFQNTDCFARTVEWLEVYFSGCDPGPVPAIHLCGSVFRRRVWELLCEIPYGKTVTYGQIAARIAAERGMEKMSAQAVGGAVGSNPVSILVPCHRVIGANGNLTGYVGGILRKKELLELEGVDCSCFQLL